MLELFQGLWGRALEDGSIREGQNDEPPDPVEVTIGEGPDSDEDENAEDE